MSDGVLYLNLGAKHGHHLIVSIVSLRQHYAGPVAIVSHNDCGVAEAIAKDNRLGPITIIDGSEIATGKRGSMYAAKTLLGDLSPFERTIFLDADTVVVGSLDFLWATKDGEVVLTQFADWTTAGNRIRGRCLGWEGVAPAEVERAISQTWPAINTGVMSWSRYSARFHRCWREMTLRNVCFICDEIACQLIFPSHKHRVVSDSFNWSPIYSQSTLAEARVLHFHGMKGRKKEAGQALWRPRYEAALADNYANLRALPKVAFVKK